MTIPATTPAGEDIQAKVEEAKRFEFLRRVCEVSGGDPGRMVPSGDLGTELGLPYEEAIQIADALDADRLVDRVGDLAPPHGPRLRITGRGVERVRERAA